MKKILILFLAAGLFVACSNNENSNEETANTESTEGTVENKEEMSAEETAEANAELPPNDAVGTFGMEITSDDAIPSTELPAQLDGKDSVFVKVKGNIRACCQAKGCWMRMSVGEDEEMMVKFKDYAFFVPRGSAGKDAVVQGWAYVEEVGVDELRHYAQDEGASPEEIEAITEPEKRMTFMAEGVVIEGSAEGATDEESQSPE